MSDPAARPRPWWRPTWRDVVVVLLLAVLAGWWHWPSPPPAPVQLLAQGSVAGTGWTILAQRAGSGRACLQVRVAGARQALMCDEHWDRDVYRIWRGPLPPSAGSTIAPPPVLRVRFPGSDRVLVVSVLYAEIATLTAPSTAVLPTKPLFDTDFHYVAGVLPAPDAANLTASAADGQPLFYYYADSPPK